MSKVAVQDCADVGLSTVHVGYCSDVTLSDAEHFVLVKQNWDLKNPEATLLTALSPGKVRHDRRPSFDRGWFFYDFETRVRQDHERKEDTSKSNGYPSDVKDQFANNV